MTAIPEQIYQVAAQDTGAGGVISMLPNGLAALLGGANSLPPSPAGQSEVWAYLGFVAEVPRWPLAGQGVPLQPSSTLTGGFQWWLYEPRKRAGYTRVRPLAQRLRLLYGPDRLNTTLWTDPATGEDVYGLAWAGCSNDTADPESGQLLVIANWQTFIAYRQESIA